MADDRPKPASFGFDADFADLSTVKPSSAAAGPKPRQSKPKGAQLSKIRGPVRILNDFITYCETEHLSYWEALEKLLEK